jgi:hypothetical protein
MARAGPSSQTQSLRLPSALRSRMIFGASGCAYRQSPTPLKMTRDGSASTRCREREHRVGMPRTLTSRRSRSRRIDTVKPGAIGRVIADGLCRPVHDDASEFGRPDSMERVLMQGGRLGLRALRRRKRNRPSGRPHWVSLSSHVPSQSAAAIRCKDDKIKSNEMNLDRLFKMKTAPADALPKAPLWATACGERRS